MSDDLEQGNPMCKTEAFLSFLIYTELLLVERFPKEFSVGDDYVQGLNFLANNAVNSKLEYKLDNWWFEDVSFLWIDQFNSKGKGMRFIGSWGAHWTAKWISGITFGLHILGPKQQNPQYKDLQINACLTYSMCGNFSFLILYTFSRSVLKMKINPELLNMLERIATILEQCMLQISGIRIMETMKVVMVWALLLGW